MKNRTFITNTSSFTKRLVAVYKEGVGMVGYVADRTISKAFVNIKEHGYFVNYSFFMMGYEEYATAASFLELPVITNYQYNEYAVALEKEYAASKAIAGAFTDGQWESLNADKYHLDEVFGQVYEINFEDYDKIAEGILCLKRLAVIDGDKPLNVGRAWLMNKADYNRFAHAALNEVLSSPRY